MTTRDITIHADADWDQSFWLLDGNIPVDLTGKRVELYVLPSFDFSTPIRILSSADDGEIVIDNATKGAASIAMKQADVAAHLPVGVWKYFLRVVEGTADIQEYRRGNLTVLAGRT